MLPIDPSLFPKLSTRRALIVVDAQNDFLEADGLLHVGNPHGLTDRIARLVREFRPYGDIVWIRSEYSQPRPYKSEQIITSDAPAPENRRSGARGRRPPATSGDQPLSRCPEAFLSGPAPGRPECVRRDTAGAELPTALQSLIEKKDISLVKTHYSGFKVPNLIQRLRMKFVNEVFICGSLSNIGVMATAVDAGSHGLDIGIIEDCCGYRSSARHRGALGQIEETTGCDIMTLDSVLDLLKPKIKPMTAPLPNPVGRRYPVVYEQRAGPGEKGREGEEARADGESNPRDSALLSSPSTSNLDAAMANMSLSCEAGAGLPPITFTRARVAARGRPTRPLPDIEERLNGLIKITGTMNASPNDDLNAGSESDDSPDEVPIKPASATAQPQDTAHARQQGNLLESARNTAISPSAAQESVKSALKRLDLGGKHVDRPAGDVAVSSDRASASPARAAASPKSDTLPTLPASKTPQQTLADNRVATAAEMRHSRDDDVIDSIAESGPLCEGDTRVHYNVLPQPLADNIFETIRDEVQWLHMSHQGGEVPRLVAVQGDIDEEGNFPIYRHPADELPPLLSWTSTVKKIKDAAEKRVSHPLNHALIQFYRDGSDYISEHSDKTLDIAKDSFVVNVSLGAERTMTFRTKRQPKHIDNPQPESTPQGSKREVQCTRLPHNSLCQMGLQTNMRWLHAIRQDKRLDRDKNTDELAYGGARISLTFRQIGTFLNREQRLIWGQGATAKTKEAAREVVNGQTPEAVKMLQAFGRENQSTEFSWDDYYGAGFDVLHISAAARLFTSNDAVANMRVLLMLAELGVGHAKGSLAAASTTTTKDGSTASEGIPLKFVDNVGDKPTVRGDMAIMLYLDRCHGKRDEASSTPTNLAREFTRFQQALDLSGSKRLALSNSSSQFEKEMACWEEYAGEAEFIAGGCLSLADFAFWPAVNEVAGASWKERLLPYPKLMAYYERIRNRETVIRILGKNKTQQKNQGSSSSSILAEQQAATVPSRSSTEKDTPQKEAPDE
jgi:nicotinamidase-related amidase